MAVLPGHLALSGIHGLALLVRPPAWRTLPSTLHVLHSPWQLRRLPGPRPWFPHHLRPVLHRQWHLVCILLRVLHVFALLAVAVALPVVALAPPSDRIPSVSVFSTSPFVGCPPGGPSSVGVVDGSMGPSFVSVSSWRPSAVTPRSHWLIIIHFIVFDFTV